MCECSPWQQCTASSAPEWTLPSPSFPLSHRFPPAESKRAWEMSIQIKCECFKLNGFVHYEKHHIIVFWVNAFKIVKYWIPLTFEVLNLSLIPTNNTATDYQYLFNLVAYKKTGYSRWHQWYMNLYKLFFYNISTKMFNQCWLKWIEILLPFMYPLALFIVIIFLFFSPFWFIDLVLVSCLAKWMQK